MLLAVVYANGTYHAHLGEHDPLSTYDASWEQLGYHDKLAKSIEEHLGTDQPVVYLPYWNNAHLTDIFTNEGKQKRAFETDPLLGALGEVASSPLFEVFPTAAGRNPKLSGHDYATEEAWRTRLLELTRQEEGGCFVGAYTRACVADIAGMVLTNTGAEVFIDPALSVDIFGKGYVLAIPVDVPYRTMSMNGND